MGWGTVIGGIVGAIAGGPVGAGIGAGIGTWIEDSDNESSQLEARATGIEDELGELVSVAVSTPLPSDAVAVLLLKEPSGTLMKATGEFADADGDFVQTAAFHEGRFWGYVPYTGLLKRSSGPFQLVLRVVRPTASTCELVGDASFVQNLPDRGSWCPIEFMFPAIQLFMFVASAEGELDAKSMRTIRALCETKLGLQDQPPAKMRCALKRARFNMASAEHFRVLAVAAVLQRRLWGADANEFARMLLAIGTASGPLTPKKREAIRIAVIGLGMEEADWTALANAEAPKLDAYFSALGLPPGASREEIGRAYRKLVKEHHPDRWTNAPASVQAEAARRTMELREAYEQLCSCVP